MPALIIDRPSFDKLRTNGNYAAHGELVEPCARGNHFHPSVAPRGGMKTQGDNEKALAVVFPTIDGYESSAYTTGNNLMGWIMRRIIAPLVFAFLIATAGTLGMVLPASADSAKAVHVDAGCPFAE